MVNGILVFLAQTLFNIFKVLEIKYTYENKIVPLLLNSLWINLVSLVSMYLSIEDMINGNLKIIAFYICGSVLGKWIGMHFKNPRIEIWNKLFKK